MNIKQAKQEIIDTVQAYLLKNEYDEYVIPRVHQRPVLLLGAPGIGKTQIMEQPESVVWHWSLIRSHITPDRVRSVFHLSLRKNMEAGNIQRQSTR